MKIKATEKFIELGIENCYQHLETEEYFALRRGEVVDIEKVPPHLFQGNYVEIIKTPASRTPTSRDKTGD